MAENCPTQCFRVWRWKAKAPSAMTHHIAQKVSDGFSENSLVHVNNSFVMYALTPDSINKVPVDEPDCPFSLDQIACLDTYLQWLPCDRSLADRVKL